MNNKKIIASGLPGFGTKGKQGDAGSDGLSVFFTDFNGDIDRKTISDRILNNKSLISGLENKDAKRPYVKGDTFVDINSNTYEILLQSNNTYKSLGYKYIPNSIFESTDYKNAFGIEKMTNVYLGDKKFLVDDIQSDTFSPNIYDSLAYNNKVGEYTKVNFSDRITPNNLFLHEAYVSEANSGRIMSIVSRYVDNSNNAAYNEFRLGNAKIDRISGVDKFTPTNTKMTIDTRKLCIPSETYVVGGDGLEHRVVSEREYDMGIFKSLKTKIISLDGILDAGISVSRAATKTKSSLSTLTINRCDYGALFNNFDNIKDNVRANLILTRAQDNSVVNIDTKNTYNLYDIPNGALDIVISNIDSGAWNIYLELIDMTNGWTRVSRTQSIRNTNQRLTLNVRMVNSYTDDLTFTLSAFTNLNIDCLNDALKVHTIKGGTATNIQLPLIVPLEADGTFNSTTLDIRCTTSYGGRRFSAQILDNENLPYYTTMQSRPNIMFNMGYNIEAEGFVYVKDNCDFLTNLTTKYGSLVLNRPSASSYDPSISNDSYNNNATLASSYGNPQAFVHEKDLIIKVYNKSPLPISMPTVVYVYSSDSAREDITSSTFIKKLKVYQIPNSEKVDIFGISSTSATVKVGATSKYVYILVDYLNSEHVDGVRFAYDKAAIREICKAKGIESYLIENPHHTNSTLGAQTYYLTVAGKEFSTGNISSPIKNGDRNNFGLYPNVLIDLTLSKNISLESMYIGFNHNKLYYKKVGNDRVINNTVYEMKGMKSIYAGAYNVLDINRGSNQLDNTAPYAFYGLSNEIKFSLLPNVTSYSSFFKTCNHENIYNRFFDAVKDETFRNLVGFNQNVFKPLSTSFTYPNGASDLNDVVGFYSQELEAPSSDDIEDIVKSELTFPKTFTMLGNSASYGNTSITTEYLDISLSMAFNLEHKSNMSFEYDYAPTSPVPGGEQLIRRSNVSLIPVLKYSYKANGQTYTGSEVLASGKTLAEANSMYDMHMSNDRKEKIFMNNFFSFNGNLADAINSLALNIAPYEKRYINYDGRIKIGNPGVLKTELKYTIELERVIYQSYTIQKPRVSGFSLVQPDNARWNNEQLPDDNLGGGGSLSRFTILKSRGIYKNLNLLFDDMVVKVGYCGDNTNETLKNVTPRYIDMGSVDTEILTTNW